MANNGTEIGFQALFEAHYPHDIFSLKELRKVLWELEKLTENSDGTASAEFAYFEERVGDYTLEQLSGFNVVLSRQRPIHASCEAFLTELQRITGNMLRLIGTLAETVRLLSTQQLAQDSLKACATLEFFATVLDTISQCETIVSRRIPYNIGVDIGENLVHFGGILDVAGLNRGVRPLLGSLDHRLEDIVVMWDHDNFNKESFKLENALAYRQDEFSILIRHIFPRAVEAELYMMRCYESYLKMIGNRESVIDETVDISELREYVGIDISRVWARQIEQDIDQLILPTELSGFQHQIRLILVGRLEYLDDVLIDDLECRHSTKPPNPSPSPNLPEEVAFPTEKLEKKLAAAVAAIQQPLPSLGPRQKKILGRMRRLFPDAVTAFTELGNLRLELANHIRNRERSLYDDFISIKGYEIDDILNRIRNFCGPLQLANDYKGKAEKRDLGLKDKSFRTSYFDYTLHLVTPVLDFIGACEAIQKA